MTRDGTSNTPPHSEPSPVLSYCGPIPQALASQVVFNRQGDTLTIHIPGGPVAAKIIVRAILLIPSLAMIALLLLPISEVFNHTEEAVGYAIFPAIGIALLVWGGITCIRSIIYLYRMGRNPSLVTVGPAGIELRAAGNIRPIVLRVQRDRIAHLQIHPDGFGITNRLTLEVIASDDSLHIASIPWPRGYPMIALEDNIRDVLGLADNGQR
ncbi:MAG TPA: hypothetical protein VFE47_12980 [Tepidisphaeraceae bacterium]|jgi:hypothetical protein|nr:hypothetical protein [Tepidisphaeraceae bacterium]